MILTSLTIPGAADPSPARAGLGPFGWRSHGADCDGHAVGRHGAQATKTGLTRRQVAVCLPEPPPVALW